MAEPKILVATATYNEADNIGDLLNGIHNELPGADILVIDDNSPDRTWERVEAARATNDRIHLMRRAGKLGLGSAHKEAFEFARRGDYDVLITLDADFSHHPRYLKPLLAKLVEGDHHFVTGSRYDAGGSCEYGFGRQLLSRTANFLVANLLGTGLRENTTSYRAFSRKTLHRFDIQSVKAEGYSFFLEIVFRISQLGLNMGSVPIRFEDRRAGSSKISRQEIAKALVTLGRLALGRLVGRFRPNKARSTARQIDKLSSL